MKKCFVCFVILIMYAVLFAGCSGSDLPTSPDIYTSAPDDETDVVVDDTSITIYTIDYNSLECVPTVSVLEKGVKADANRIIEEVIVNFKEEVRVTDITQTKDSITVTFSDEAAPAMKVSEEMEFAMLDCIAYSLLDNLDYCNEVYFKTNEDGYSSTYNSWAHNEPYASK